MKDSMSRADFIRLWASTANPMHREDGHAVHVKIEIRPDGVLIDDHEQWLAVACWCDAENCHGWQMVPASVFREMSTPRSDGDDPISFKYGH